MSSKKSTGAPEGTPADYNKPASANEYGLPLPTMKWSSTRTSTVARALFSRSVIARSAAEGSVFPEGC